MRLASSSAKVAPSAPGTVRDVPCPVLLDLFVAGLARIGGDPHDLFFRSKVFANLSGVFVVDWHLLILFFSHIIVRRGSMDIETAHPVLICDARNFTIVMTGSYGSRAGSRARVRYAP